MELKLNSFKFKHLQLKNPVPGSLANELPKDKLFFLKQIPTIEINGEAEKIQSEITKKFTFNTFRILAKSAGWKVKKYWVDKNKYYSIFLLQNK